MSTDARATRSSYFAAAAGLLVTVAVVAYPEASFEASVAGLRLWFDIVLPALLPFFTLAEVLMGLGVIHMIGVLLEPVMRPVFRIPGAGGFAVAMGLASGYPLGSKIGGRLCREGLCTREEGERLVAFANTADPLFMIGAVAVGMFGAPQIGVTIAAAHYLSAVIVGVLMRYHGTGASGATPRTAPRATGRRESLFARALRALVEARRKETRPFGQLFGDAVRDSVQSMLFIGGCIMMFSVFLNVLTVSGVIGLIASPLARALAWTGLSPELVVAMIKGSVEITIGAQAAGAADASLAARTVVASAIIAWSGFSVHAQVAAMVHGTSIRMGPYLAARLLHAVLAAVCTLVLFEPLGGAAASVAALSGFASGGAAPGFPLLWAAMGAGALGILGALLVLSLAIYAVSRVRIILWRV